METTQITLNRGKSNHSTNVDNYIGVDLSSNDKLLQTSELQSTIDEYQQYLKEKNASKKYRFIFTINPVCSNVLFNRITELVYGEGSDNCVNITTGAETPIKGCIYYTLLKAKTLRNNNRGGLNKHQVTTQDTGFSSVLGNFKNKKGITGSLEYKCGLDIFNNHHLRRTEFVVINQGFGSTFNTIFDVVRDKDGRTEKMLFDLGSNDTNEKNFHLYDKSTILSANNLSEFSKILDYSLEERDGWFGFTNKAILPIVHYKKNKTDTVSINKIMCNKRECDFIDLYPDRTLFSFVPKWNPYRKRAEYNWKYCLTYPYANVTNNSLVVSGIPASFDVSSDNEITFYSTDKTFSKESSVVRIRTDIRHNLQDGSLVYITLKYKPNIIHNIPYPIRVSSVGKYGYDSQHYFTINFNDISYAVRAIFGGLNNDKKISDDPDLKVYVKRMGTERVCKYYIRKFRRIPNFKNTKYSNLNKIDDETIIRALLDNDFNSTINKLGFSKNFYGDDLSQIVFNDDIDVTGLKDNLGRDLSEVYLTIVKNNAGWSLWYNDKKTNTNNIEYSHCFGKVSSGFDLPEYIRNYNVHCLHNISNVGFNNWANFPLSGTPVEANLTMSYDFYGDIVELDEGTLTETVLEVIQHRFNTAQRETTNETYSALTVDNIISDDYDGTFKSATTNNIVYYKQGSATKYIRANIAPEGYYYQAHYPIKIREYDEVLNEGFHTIINYTNTSTTISNTGVVEIKCDKNYFFNVSDIIYVFDKKTDNRYNGTISSVSEDFLTLKITGLTSLKNTKIGNYVVFKPNSEMPTTAYDLYDENGRYIWRNFKNFEYLTNDSELYDSTFTNGAHYIHKQINFYLKRQDPTGIYGLKPSVEKWGATATPYSYLEVDGQFKDISDGDYFNGEENNCLKF